MPLLSNGEIKLDFPDRDVQVGDTIPNFSRPSHDGKIFKLSQQTTPIAILCLGSISNPYALDKLKAIESGSVDLAGHKPVVLTASGLREIRNTIDSSEELKTFPVLSDENFSEEILNTFATRREDGTIAYNLVFLDAGKKVTRLLDTDELTDKSFEYIPSAIRDAAFPTLPREEYQEIRDQQIQETAPPPGLPTQAIPSTVPGILPTTK